MLLLPLQLLLKDAMRQMREADEKTGRAQGPRLREMGPARLRRRERQGVRGQQGRADLMGHRNVKRREACLEGCLPP